MPPLQLHGTTYYGFVNNRTQKVSCPLELPTSSLFDKGHDIAAVAAAKRSPIDPASINHISSQPVSVYPILSRRTG